MLCFYVLPCVCVCVAPIRGLILEQSRMSGYEEMKCTVNNVFPAPRVTWETEPPTFESLRPVTRIIPNKMGLYSVDSRLKKLKGLPDIIYICKVTRLYSGQTWTASIRQRGDSFFIVVRVEWCHRVLKYIPLLHLSVMMGAVSIVDGGKHAAVRPFTYFFSSCNFFLCFVDLS